jgi:hypothetical protein
MFNARSVQHLHGRIGAWTAIAGTALAICSQAAWAQPSYKWVAATTVLARQVSLNGLPPYVPAPGTTRPSPPPPPSTGLSESEERALRERAVAPEAGLPNAPLPPPTALPGAPGTGPAIAFEGNYEAKCGMPGASDMALAVGDDRPTYPVLQVNNYCINLFTKTGVLAPGYPKKLDGLFPVEPFDPRALYDWVNRRYIIVASQGNADGHYWVAVSKDNDPGGTYFVYRLPIPSGGSGFFADFPRLGQDRQTIYIASNKFTYNSSRTFAYEEWLFLPKAAMYQGKNFTYKFTYDMKFDGVATDTSQPVNAWNPAEDPPVGFFVASKNLTAGAVKRQPGGYKCRDTPCNGLVVMGVANPLWDGTGTDPGVSGAAVATRNSYIMPPTVWQGQSTKINVGDTRISGQAGYGAGSLFASLTTKNAKGGASAILFKIRPQMCNPRVRMLIGATITDEAVLDFGQDTSSFLATTQPDAHGNTLTVFNIAGRNNFLSTAYVMRSATQPAGTFQDSGVIVRAGRAPYGNEGGWGDYTAVAPALSQDSRNPPQLWFAGEYTPDANRNEGGFKYTDQWNTVIGYNSFLSSAQ